MIPSLVLVTAFVVLRAAGFAAVTALDNWNAPLRIALAVMFLVTASAHWGRGRAGTLNPLAAARQRCVFGNRGRCTLDSPWRQSPNAPLIADKIAQIYESLARPLNPVVPVCS